MSVVVVVCTIAYVPYLYVLEVGRRAAIVSTLRDVSAEIWTFHQKNGKFPDNTPSLSWKVNLLQDNYPGKDISNLVRRYAHIRGVFDEAGRWLVDDAASISSNPVLVVFFESGSAEIGSVNGDLIIEKNGDVFLTDSEPKFEIRDSLCLHLCRRNSRIESVCKRGELRALGAYLLNEEEAP